MGSIKVLACLSLVTFWVLIDSAFGFDRPKWFVMPGVAELRNSGVKVFAHYHPAFPLQVNDLPASRDYYELHWLRAEGESGKFAHCGGRLRDRPLPVPGAGDLERNGRYQRENFKIEVRDAINAGLDGFDFNLSHWGGETFDQLILMLEAAREVDPGFRISIKPDASIVGIRPTLGLPVTDWYEKVATALARLKTYPNVMKSEDGRLVFGPYAAERLEASAWLGLTLDLERRGLSIAFMPTFHNPYLVSPGQVPPVTESLAMTYSRVFGNKLYGMLDWSRPGSGCRPYRDLLGPSFKVCGGSVMSQYFRPNNLTLREANGSSMLRSRFSEVTSNGVNWINLVTWNDYSEGTHLAPSRDSGDSFLHLISYFVVVAKSGIAPSIVKDRLFLLHRRHGVATAASEMQKLKVVLDGRTLLLPAPLVSSPDSMVDQVEALAFTSRTGGRLVVAISCPLEGCADKARAKSIAVGAPGLYTVSLTMPSGAWAIPKYGISAKLVGPYSPEVLRLSSPFGFSAESPDFSDLQYRAVSVGR